MMTIGEDKQKFWDALCEPQFEAYACSSCKHSNPNNFLDRCNHPTEKGYCQGYDHPSRDPKNKWEWDGKTYENNDMKIMMDTEHNMNKPNLINIDRMKKKIRNLTKPNMTLTAQELKAFDSDIDQLLLYTVELQAEIIELKQNGGGTTEIELDGGDFFGK